MTVNPPAAGTPGNSVVLYPPHPGMSPQRFELHVGGSSITLVTGFLQPPPLEWVYLEFPHGSDTMSIFLVPGFSLRLPMRGDSYP